MSWKDVIRGWTPPVIYESARGAFGDFTSSRVRRQASESTRFWSEVKDSQRDRIAHVLGNGPSLANIDPETLQGGIVISMNAFGLHPHSGDVDVDFHCIAEPRSDLFSWDSYSELRVRGLLPRATRNLVVHPSHLSSLPAKVDGEPRIRIVSMERTWTRVTRDESLDLAQGIGACQSTAILAIAVAVHLGCERVVLYGMEHDYLAHSERSLGSVTAPYQHFYPESDYLSADFRNEQSVEIESATSRKYLEHIELVASVFKQHDHLAAMSRRNGQHISNVTPNSFLDAYD